MNKLLIVHYFVKKKLKIVSKIILYVQLGLDLPSPNRPTQKSSLPRSKRTMRKRLNSRAKPIPDMKRHRCNDSWRRLHGMQKIGRLSRRPRETILSCAPNRARSTQLPVNTHSSPKRRDCQCTRSAWPYPGYHKVKTTINAANELALSHNSGTIKYIYKFANTI